MYEYDGVVSVYEAKGVCLVGVENVWVVYVIDKVDVLLVIDFDLFGSDGDMIKNACFFVEG